MNRTNSPIFLPRRTVLAGGARLLGTLALGPVAGLFADGCARQPKNNTNLGQVLLNVQFEVAGAIASGSATTPTITPATMFRAHRERAKRPAR